MYYFITLGYSNLAHHIITYLYLYYIHIYKIKFAYLVTYLLTPWSRVLLEKLTGFQLEIPSILWNTKFHYRIHKCPPHVPILIQLDPRHTLTSHFLKIHFNIILTSMPGSPKWSLSFRFPHQKPLYGSPLLQTLYIPHPSHASLFYHANKTGWAVQVIKLLFM
jgi:hypothetical protein